jgi:hypothetical protein
MCMQNIRISDQSESIVEYLRRHKLIKDTQYGIVKGRSCLTKLLFFFEEIMKDVDQGSPVNVIYLGF